MKGYDIKDVCLWVQGEKDIKYAADRMEVLSGIDKSLAGNKPLKGVKIALSIHLEAKTAYLCEVLHNLGADLRVTGSNSLTTRDDIAAALVHKGISVFAKHACSNEEYEKYIEQSLEFGPNIIVDDGADLVATLHTKFSELLENVWGRV